MTRYSTEETKDDSVNMDTKAPDGSKVSIELRVIAGRVPADGVTTRVGIHFGVVGDEEASARILDRVGERLGVAPPQAQAQTPPPPGAQQLLRPVPQPTAPGPETPAPPLAPVSAGNGSRVP